jgi:hypothetical protein
MGCWPNILTAESKLVFTYNNFPPLPKKVF